jgi:MFS family permease
MLKLDPALWREQRWLALWAAMFGFMLDAMDVMLYALATQEVVKEFGLTKTEAGLATTAMLVVSSIGGIIAGVLCDRIGRKRTLIYTVLIYSFASLGTAFSTGLASLIFWRALIGLGLGGEWSAGAVLVAETWPAEKRGRAIALMQSGWAIGYMLAAALAALILPVYGWRALFAAGVLPALLTFFIRAKVQEPAVWNPREGANSSLAELFRGPLLARTLLATTLATAVLFGYWGLFTWLPGFLSAPASAGGAGLSIVRASGFLIAVQAGAFCGYLTFGWISDRIGRRPSFAGFVAMAALLSAIYGTAPQWAGGNARTVLLVLGPLIGFFGTGFFSLFGTMLAELYPTRIRGAGQGFAYNFGRGLSALAPLLVGAAADSYGLGAALGINALFFLAGAVIVFTLPETKGTQLI